MSLGSRKVSPPLGGDTISRASGGFRTHSLATGAMERFQNSA